MPQLYVATNGLSVWESGDLGATIARMPSGTGLYSGSQVWALASHPARPETMLAGTDSGLYRLDRKAARWTHLASPMDEERLVTALAFAPDDPETILAGTQPSALYRSEDGGRSWRRIETAMKRFTTSGFLGSATPGRDSGGGDIKHWTRVTQILFDPDDPDLIWAGVEIDGAWRSRDRGRRWERVSEGFETDDIHGFAVVRERERILYATTNAGLHRSRDAGATWQRQRIDSPWQYTRSIVERAERSGVMLMTNGNGPPGSAGRLYRSRDYGMNWESVTLPAELESSVYFLATHPADPELIFVAANLGQIFRSSDGAESWVGLKRRLGEIRALIWLPDVVTP
jgi:photosystem II stability/assembly factor-like uncharacterized protein